MRSGFAMRLRAFRRRLLPWRWSLALDARRINRLYAAEVKTLARKPGVKSEDLESLQTTWAYEAREIDEELAGLATRHLIRQARRLSVPTPEIPWKSDDGNEFWEKGHASETWYLKPAGIALVRGAIRTELKERREARIAWATPLIALLGAVSGVLAVITSLLAILRK